MKILTILLMLTLKWATIYSQIDSSKIVEELRSIVSFKYLENKLEEIDTKFKKSKYEESLGFGYKKYENRFNFLNTPSTVIVILKGDSLFSKLIILDKGQNKANTNKIFDTVINKTDSVFVNRFINEHNKYFGTNFKGGDYGFANCGEFGIACGLGGSPQAGMKKVCELVHKHDNKKLYEWAVSISPQDRIHGVVGLFFLKKNGFHLSSVEEKAIRMNINSEATVVYCQGCGYGRTGTMKYLLRKKSLNNYYSWYKLSGWNRI